MVVYLNFGHLTSNTNNIIAKSNIAFEYFMTDEIACKTPRDRTIDIANGQIRNYGKNFFISVIARYL